MPEGADRDKTNNGLKILLLYFTSIKCLLSSEVRQRLPSRLTFILNRPGPAGCRRGLCHISQNEHPPHLSCQTAAEISTKNVTLFTSHPFLPGLVVISPCVRYNLIVQRMWGPRLPAGAPVTGCDRTVYCEVLPGTFVPAFRVCCVTIFCLAFGEPSHQHTHCQTSGPSGAHQSFLSRKSARPSAGVRERLVLRHGVTGILVFATNPPLRDKSALRIRRRVGLHIARIARTLPSTLTCHSMCPRG